MKSKCFDYTMLTLVIIGAINWGLIGFFKFDLVAFLFGQMTWLSRVIYAISDYVACILLVFLAEFLLLERNKIPRHKEVLI